MAATWGGTNIETSIKDKDRAMLLENKGLSIDQRSDGESESESTITKVAIPDDDLIVQILARLDGSSYSRALYKDARSINENFLVPPNFPWHSRKRLPQKMMKTMPRDIDDLHVITHCQDELHAPFGDFQGPFGFGRYENGHVRGNCSSSGSTTPLVNMLSLKTDRCAPAAARRSDDPGVLELNAQIPLPSSIYAISSEDTNTLTLSEKWKAELLKDPARAVTLSHLPFHWSKKGDCLSIGQRMDHADSGTQESHIEPNESDFDSQKLTQSRSRSRAQLEMARSCARKWKISMKVGGVSSRATLFASSTDVDNTDSDQGLENTRTVIRPMLCLASLPQSIQFGQTVPIENAMEMDKNGFAHSLGSYDCRYTDALLNPKRDSFNRGKRIEVGRTRLLWSNLIQGDTFPLPSNRNRLTLNCLITGQRVDASKCKRPTAVKVGVRINGRFLMEKALEDLPTTTMSNVRKRKHSTRQSENQGPALKSRIQCPESRTDEEIDAALCNNSTIQAQPQNVQHIQQRSNNGAVIYLEMGSQSFSHSDIDRNDIIAALLKSTLKKSAQRKLKGSTSSDNLSIEGVPTSYGGIEFIKKCTPPRFACVPLEDGLLRTICVNAGNMPGTSVHQVIRQISEQENDRRCSVCWSDEGSGKEGVQKCVKCGLLAHSNCCLGKGEFSIASSDSNGTATHSNAKTHVEIEPSDYQSEHWQWQCTVCCRYTEMKPRRNSRMPSRFVDGETYALFKYTGDDDSANRNANVPGPRCLLCPHRGGAMSPLKSRDDSDLKWAHEVCRVWSGIDLSDDSAINGCSPIFQQFPNRSPLSNVCALCGTGRNKSMAFDVGLTKCAARGCHVAFHPMCAMLASKVGMDEDGGEAKSVRTRKTRRTDQVSEEKKLDANGNVEADKKLCREYTLQLVQLTRTESSPDEEEDKTAIIPVAFCGIHNPRREDSFFGCPPGGDDAV
mmetsp:Transcript_32195/g.69483  ORF Transcript_32195/g.69483 Transcript_32195/m.69483 type:complete len:954 (+) Transcript_32195:30-2891(+)